MLVKIADIYRTFYNIFSSSLELELDAKKGMLEDYIPRQTVSHKNASNTNTRKEFMCVLIYNAVHPND